MERAFARLSLQPSSLCRQCRRSFASSSAAQQSATGSFVDSLESPPGQQRRPPIEPVAPLARSASLPSTRPTQKKAYEMAEQVIRDSTASRRERTTRQAFADLERNYTRRDLELQVPRRWNIGDVYAPHDLTGTEMSKWKSYRRKPKPKFDVLDQLGINPLHHYKNYSMMSEYVTEIGSIKHSNFTSLRPVNQRKMAKAIRRAMGTGMLMPGVHRHPELLRIEWQNHQDKSSHR